MYGFGSLEFGYRSPYGDFSFHPEIEADSEEPAAVDVDDEDLIDAHPELTCKVWLGWRISYRTTAPEARTFESFRPRLRKMVEVMGPRLIDGAQRHRRSNVVIGNFARNGAKKILRQKVRAKVLYLQRFSLTCL